LDCASVAPFQDWWVWSQTVEFVARSLPNKLNKFEIRNFDLGWTFRWCELFIFKFTPCRIAANCWNIGCARSFLIGTWDFSALRLKNH
jgi:hypothetical protein